MELLPQVKRSNGKVRLFDDGDIAVIKKIKKMQKEESLSLEMIKDRLFGKKIKDKQSVGVYVQNTIHLPTHLKNNPLIEQFNQETDSIDTLCEHACCNHLKTVYIFSTTATHDINVRYIEDQCDVHHIVVHHLNLSISLLIDQLAEGVQQNYSEQELNLLVKKNIHMLKDYYITEKLKHIISPEWLNHSLSVSVATAIAQFFPVLSIVNTVNVLAFHRSLNAARNCLFDHFKTEVEQRGNYLNKVLVAHLGSEKDAQSIYADIKMLFPNIDVFMLEMSASSSILKSAVGEKMISLSII